MNSRFDLREKVSLGLTLLLVTLLVGGCLTPGDRPPPTPSSTNVTEVLHVGDLVVVKFSGVPAPPRDHEEFIKDDGMITLPLGLQIAAEGKTSGQLQKEIRAYYVPKYYQDYLNVTVIPGNRYFFVFGEVKLPGQKPYTGEMTVLKAIATAGGFTDFAGKRRVKLTRSNGEKRTINCVKAQDDSRLDLQVFPGDTIRVPRSIL